MDVFSISRLETDIGVIHAEGMWDAITEDVQLTELALYQADGWTDISFWLNEQEHEGEIATLIRAIRIYLR